MSLCGLRQAPARDALPMDIAPFFTTAEIRTTDELRRAGVSEHQLTALVRARSLLRVRRGHYALPGAADVLLRAVRIGGRVACVSAAWRYGIWVAKDLFPHVAMAHSASRLRSPANRFRALDDQNRDGCTLHWSPTADSGGYEVSLIDSLVQIVRCQSAPLAIAALDSALNSTLLANLDEVFARLPRRYARLEKRVDRRSMSGIETLVRLMVEDAGIPFDLQVTFAGVGDVDLVLDDRVVIEVDGREHHENKQLRDYARDAALAARGYVVLRFDYAQVVYAPDVVMAAIRGALSATRGSRRPGSLC